MKKTNIDIHGSCPVCKTNWDEGDILEFFLDQKKKGHWKDSTEAEIKKMVEECYSPPRRFSKVIGIELQGEDRISKYKCPECECEFDRFEDEK